MVPGLRLEELLDCAARCAIVDRDGSTVYRNDRKGAELFARRFPGIDEIARVVESSAEVEITRAAEAGAGTPAVLDFLLRLKASLSAVGRNATKDNQAVTSTLTEPLKMALAELDLERAGQIADGPGVRLAERPFFRLGSELRPCGFDDETVLADLRARLPDAAAVEIARRKQEYEKTYGSPRLVYAASEPVPMAAIFLPPWSEPGIEGNTSAAYPPGGPYRRVAFGRVLDVAQGVTFLDLYYLVDLWAASAP